LRRFKYDTARVLLVVMMAIASLALPWPSAHAASIYDGIVQTTTHVELRTSTAYCPGSSAVDHSNDWPLIVSTALSDFNAAHSNALADWEADWENRIGWAVFSVSGANNQKYFLVYYSASYGQNYFFTAWSTTDYFAVSDPSPATPFRSLLIHTIGDNYGNCNDTPLVGSASTGGLSLTASDFSGNYKLFFSTFPTMYPSNYEGELIPSSAPPVEYVAMGDSFSSGEGNPSFEYGTDTSSNKCHRSPYAYPRLLQSDSSLDLGSTAFVACSGATTDDVLNGGSGAGNWDEGPQVDALSSDAEVVTITIGGNNIKFGEFAYACLFGSCNNSSYEYQESWDVMTDLTRSDYLPTKLDSLFSDIAFHLWQNTSVKVYVVGYPYVITQASWNDRGVGICSDFDEDEAIAAETIVSKLDTVIETAVTDFDDSRFVYVDPLATGSPFLGHELCRNGSYFNGIETSGALGGDDAYVFHPDTNGQQAYADLIRSYMS